MNKQLYFVLILGAFLVISLLAKSQRFSDVSQFKHHTVVSNNDTIYYHTYSHSSANKVDKLLLFCQGSSASPIYLIQKERGKVLVRTIIPFDLRSIPSDYLLVVISKKGLPFTSRIKDSLQIPKKYFENQTLNYRVFQADNVLRDIREKTNSQFEKTVVMGHSEGSDVVAKLGTISEIITHIGYFSGGGPSQFFDLITLIRKDVTKGILSESEAQTKIDDLLEQFKAIMSDPNSIERFWNGKSNTFKRWSHFSEPPIDNLLKINCPIYVAIGSQDNTIPVESTYLIPIEFIRHKKDNMTFKVYPNLDHGFRKILKNGRLKNEWDKIFVSFIRWVEKK